MSNGMDYRPGKSAVPWREKDLDRLEVDLPLAVFLVGGEEDLGSRSFRLFEEQYRDKFRQILFVSVAMDNCAPFTGEEEEREIRAIEDKERQKRTLQTSLDTYLAAAHELGMRATARVAISKKPLETLDVLTTEILKEYPTSVFFISKLSFKKPRWFQPFLYGGTADKLRKRLQEKRFPVTVIPVLV